MIDLAALATLPANHREAHFVPFGAGRPAGINRRTAHCEQMPFG
jgi:hypothetical protein